MNKGYFVLILLFILSVSMASATLDINSPSDIVIKNKEAYNFDFYVFDANTSLKVTNSSASCIIDIIDKNGSYLLQTPLNYDTTLNTWQKTITGGNFSYNGFYTYFVNCNTTTQGGYSRANFEVTDNGLATDQQVNAIKNVGMLIAAALVSFLFLFFAFNVDSIHFLLKLLYIFLGLITILTIPAMIINGAASYITLLRMTQASFLLFVVYFFVYLFWDWIKRNEALMNSIKGAFGKR